MRDEAQRSQKIEFEARLTDASARETGQPIPRNDKALLKVTQVAAMLQVSEAWVRDHSTRKRPRLKYVKVGKLLRYRLVDIEEFIATWCQ
ncbi:MAG: helix-turn-helix domain-containing protein [Bryobacteraceae bacterium]|jgi:predicted DNA-binding transcriptional regulator AlpA